MHFPLGLSIATPHNGATTPAGHFNNCNATTSRGNFLNGFIAAFALRAKFYFTSFRFEGLWLAYFRARELAPQGPVRVSPLLSNSTQRPLLNYGWAPCLGTLHLVLHLTPPQSKLRLTLTSQQDRKSSPFSYHCMEGDLVTWVAQGKAISPSLCCNAMCQQNWVFS